MREVDILLVKNEVLHNVVRFVTSTQEMMHEK